jgi:type IV secretory pathway VirJ component
VIAYYRARWHRSRVVLLGFSQGADVLPFIWNRLPASERAAVKATVALSIGQHATFEFHVANWVATQTSGRATLPEMQHLAGHNAWCVYGATDDSSLCPELDAQNFSRVRLPGGHHFDGHYDDVARIVMDALAHGQASQ